MAEDNKDQEKTEQATSKRKQDAREKGQVAKSRELASVAVLGAVPSLFLLRRVCHGKPPDGHDEDVFP